MDKVGSVRMFLSARKQQSFRWRKWRKRQSIKRRRAFAQKQTDDRLVFSAVVSSKVHGPTERTLWSKERSNHWWGRVVNSTFTPQDWLDNFRMSHDTFLYLCSKKLQSAIEKHDTVMRKAVQSEQ